MSYVIEATYENGLLKLDEPLPLSHQQRVKVVVDDHVSVAKRSLGMMGWKGDPNVVERMALDPEAGILGSP